MAKLPVHNNAALHPDTTLLHCILTQHSPAPFTMSCLHPCCSGSGKHPSPGCSGEHERLESTAGQVQVLQAGAGWQSAGCDRPSYAALACRSAGNLPHHAWSMMAYWCNSAIYLALAGINLYIILDMSIIILVAVVSGA